MAHFEATGISEDSYVSLVEAAHLNLEMNRNLGAFILAFSDYAQPLKQLDANQQARATEERASTCASLGNKGIKRLGGPYPPAAVDKASMPLRA